ncbi:MAG: hypothetical protein A3H45_01720 [Ignavibacteria bacterium RIFCSPLOWO2_02_FULL_55_14]|nr:MAG: hypothetical protein A3H45_01720 [Ignavibacteria bacterium RIFCSPLOWO2_02_FULL_55_14]
MDQTDFFQIGAAFGPILQSMKEYNDEAAAFYKQQRSLVDEQKRHDKTIKNATVWMAISTGFMALAIIFQCYLMYSTSLHITSPKKEQAQTDPTIQSPTTLPEKK